MMPFYSLFMTNPKESNIFWCENRLLSVWDAAVQGKTQGNLFLVPFLCLEFLVYCYHLIYSYFQCLSPIAYHVCMGGEIEKVTHAQGKKL
jgi:hypothetical protein